MYNTCDIGKKKNLPSFYRKSITETLRKKHILVKICLRKALQKPILVKNKTMLSFFRKNITETLRNKH